jgi:hypothetical protein
MIKQYNILSAKPSNGDPDQYGNVSFWLEIEEEGSAVVSRKPSSPLLSGPTWGELEERKSQKGNIYKKFTVKPSPDQQGSPRGSERVYKADPEKQASIEWQASVKAGVEAVRDFYTFSGEKPESLEAYKRDIVNTAITFGKTIEKKPEQTIAAPDEDPELPPTDQLEAPEDVQITLDDIPF